MIFVLFFSSKKMISSYAHDKCTTKTAQTENADGDISQRYGINSRSILNMSRYFHVVEGLLQYEVKEYLKYAIYEEHFLTLEKLYTSIKEFDYGYPDASNKLSLISSKTLNSGTNSLKQRGLRIIFALILRINKT